VLVSESERDMWWMQRCVWCKHEVTCIWQGGASRLWMHH